MTTSDQQIRDMTTNEMIKLLERFAEAQRRSDLDALSELLTDDFKLVGPLGFVVPKHQWLEQFHSGALHIESLDWDEVDIRTHAYANFAIAIGKLTQARAAGPCLAASSRQGTGEGVVRSAKGGAV